MYSHSMNIAGTYQICYLGVSSEQFLNVWFIFLCHFRYRKSIRAIEQGIEEVPSIVPALKQTTGREVPLNTNSELILFCRRVYEFRLRRLIKNPS